MIKSFIYLLQEEIRKDPHSVWVTSDHHFNHKNLLGFENGGYRRGDYYSSIEEMNSDLIAVHNSLVGKLDLVIHLGDVTLGNDGLSWLSRMNGNFLLLNTSTHHDSRWLDPYRYGILSDNVTALPPIIDLRLNFMDNRLYVALSHYPLKEWNASFHGSVNLHGHCHSNDHVNRLPNQLDCGVDNAFNLLGSYRPFTFYEAITLAVREDD